MTDSSEQKKRQLSGKQKAFIDAYIGPARFNATAAARIAGYSDPQQSGWENKQNQDIRARIDDILQAETLTATEILHELTDVAMRDLDEEVEIRQFGKDEHGDPILSARMDASAKMKALELLGKHDQLFTENVNHSGGVRIEIAGMADSELP